MEKLWLEIKNFKSVTMLFERKYHGFKKKWDFEFQVYLYYIRLLDMRLMFSLDYNTVLLSSFKEIPTRTAHRKIEFMKL